MAVRRAVIRVHPHAFFVKNRSLRPPPMVTLRRLVVGADGVPYRAVVWRGDQVRLSPRMPAERREAQDEIEAAVRRHDTELGLAPAPSAGARADPRKHGAGAGFDSASASTSASL